MGEDSQVSDSDEGYGLSPALDDSGKFDGLEGIIFSVDGSYATSKQTVQHRARELKPCFETTLDHSRNVRSGMSGRSIIFQSGVVLDESHSIFASISRKSHVRIPQSLDTPLKLEEFQSSTSLRPSCAKYRAVSPVRIAGSDGSDWTSTQNVQSQYYDPLRKFASEPCGLRDPTFNSELNVQERKLMDGLRAIIHYCGKRDGSISTSERGAMITALPRSGSSSSISTGRDALTKEVRNLQEAFAGIDFRNRSAAGRNDDDTIADSFAGDAQVITIEQPLTGSRGSSTVEEARLSSVHLLADKAIHDADECTKALRCGTFSQVAMKEKGTNTQGGERVCVKHHIITHRLKTVRDHHQQHQRPSTMPSSAVHMPTFQPFILDKRRTLPDVDSISHHGNCVDVRCCGILDEADMGTTIHAYGARHQRRVGGGKRGRPVIAGRRLYGRCRKHFRFTPSNHVAPEAPDEEKQVEEPKIVCDASAATDDNAAQTSTEDDTRGVDDESVLATTSDPVKSNHNKKRSVAKELPFLSSGQEGSSTFSLVGNQQQVMKIASSKFQEWLPLIRSIIYDAGCKDYVKAFQRDLTRQKLCHAEQLRLLEVDLKNCRNGKKRREVHAEIVRYKQHWTREHDRVLAHVNEHLSRGGVWSKVQQLRTIYASLTQ